MFPLRYGDKHYLWGLINNGETLYSLETTSNFMLKSRLKI